MTLVLDRGALLALERDDRAMWRRFKSARLAGSVPVSHGGVIGQAWRDDSLGRGAGTLLRKAGASDVIDAALVLLAEDGDEIVTSDPGDLAALAGRAELHVDLVPV